MVQAQGKVVKNWEDEYLLVRQERDELAKLLSQFRGEGGAIPSLSEVSPYWRSVEQKTRHAIGEYTEWRASVRTVQKTKNLQEWLTDSIGADNREAEVIKKVLSDYFEDSL